MKRTRSALLAAVLAVMGLGMGCELALSPDGTLLNGDGGRAAGGSGQGGEGGLGVGGMGGLGGGGAQPCTDPSMCPGADDACETRTCEGGVCGLDFVADGTAIAAQTAEDCQLVVCDGAGATKGQPDDTDIFDDGNPCTTDGCDAGTPTNLPNLAGDACAVGNGVFCDGQGNCVECLVGSDCVSGVCAGNACIPPDCVDGVLNGNETDVDCGGDTCPLCDDGFICEVGSDCLSGVCDGALFTCSTATCGDTVKNQDETDADCGGLTCGPCGPGLGCAMDSDCLGGSCSGAVCLPTCTDTTQNQDETDVDCGGLVCSDCTNGSGCLVAGDCASNFCNGTSCAACSGDLDCAGNEHCTAGVCVPDLGVGLSCGGDGQCLTGQCEDGVCCATDCSGTCQACVAVKTGGVDGTCANVVGATDPDTECAATECTTGTCDGNGACGNIGAGTSCGSTLACSGTTQTNQDTCDGAGLCTDNGNTVCAPYVCGATSCKTTCVTGADCTGGSFCSAGVCVGQKPQGAACSAAVECSNGNCVDGFCCSSACSGTCQACATAKTGAANGTCANVPTATDPDSECANGVACQTGSCNGSGACGNDASGTTCGSALSCSGTTQTNQDTCSGAGACVDNGTTSCGAYVCGATSCKTSCVTGVDCASGNFCNAGICQAQKAQGAVCATSVECSSGNCVDGFCCSSACGSTCQACSNAKTGAANGLCANVTTATDPDSECANGIACQTGTCNGSGACGNDASGSACGDVLSCSANTQTNADACNGSGSCTDNGTTTCAPYVCGASSCKTTCVTIADCQGGNFCNAGVCQAQKAQGAVCAANAECSGGSCVDGFCCSSACGSTCQACSNAKTGAADGLCANVTTATDPDNECANGVACQTGTCDGSGACGNDAAGTLCGSALSCSGTTQTNQDTCSGAGACVDNGTTSCGVYACGATSCNTSCVTLVDCASGNFCNAGVCQAQKAQGAVCAVSAECSSGSCVDGFCCSSACGSTCEACSNAKTGAADGTCASVTTATDPDGECADGVPCQTGTCNGSGACGNSASGSACGDVLSCSGSTLTNADTCNGAGACTDAGTASCSPFACGATSCNTSCVTVADCVNGAFCSGGLCQLSLPQGTACTNNAECLSGNCVDNFCCESACSGTCQACSAAKTGVADGTCASVPTTTDPDNECASTECTTGFCNGAGACGNQNSGTPCGDSASCSGTTQTNADSCNGSGACTDNGSVACAPFGCGATVCNTTCVTVTDCALGNFCVAGVCQSTLPQGFLCALDADCASGACVDGFCCDSACGGSCQACAAAKTGGTDGTCAPVLGNTDPDGECAVGACTTGLCDGVGACGNLGAGTACGDALSCAAGIQTNADSCDGSGVCGDSGTTTCGPYNCGPLSCLAVCAVDGDCSAGNFCSGGACVAQLAQGATCATNNQCGSGSCVDGVCCDSACGGTCQACSAAKTGGADGTCAPVANGADPDNECASTQCVTGTCNGAGACGSLGAGSACGSAQACVPGLETVADLCDGAGACVDMGTKFCGAYACSGSNACLTSCTTNADCAAGLACSGGVCSNTCGDGVVGPGEACDDDFTFGGDGCSADCQIETGWSCSGTPSFCSLTQEIACNDGGDNDGDTLIDCADPDCALGCDATAFAGGCPAGQNLVVAKTTGSTPIVDLLNRQAAIQIGLPGVVRRAVVSFDLSHTADGNLDISLAAPNVIVQPNSGSSGLVTQGLELSTDNGSTSDNFVSTVLSDSCATLVSSASAPFTGCFKPEFPLAVTSGSVAAGPWRLVVFDDTAVDTGTINAFTLALCVSPCGDGVITNGELCDDGNSVGGDGCSANCAVEAGKSCTGTPSFCTTAKESVCNDGFDDDGDSLVDCADADCALGCDATAFAGGCAAGDKLVVAASTGGAATITDRGAFVSSIGVAQSGVVSKVAMKFDISHISDSDLDLFLVAPKAIPAEISTDNGSTGDNYTNTIISDLCTTVVSSGTAPFTGCFKPEDLMSRTIVGTDARGEWRFQAVDDATGTTGTLNSWSIAMCVATCGDGITSSAESCDDGNAVGGDGCSALCQVEAGYSCTGLTCTVTSEAACNDNSDNDGDGLKDCADPDCALGCDATAFGGGCAPGERLTVGRGLPVPFVINDSDHHDLNVTFAGTAPVTKMATRFDITHTFDGDIDLMLAANGQVIDLTSDNLSTGDNYTATTLSDACSTSIAATANVAPATGCFAPEDAMSSVRTTLAGPFRVDLFDDATGDQGAITKVELAVCSSY